MYEDSKEYHRIKKMGENLFKRLRESMFAMDDRGECLPQYVAERVMKYAPKALLKAVNKPILVYVTLDLLQVCDLHYKVKDVLPHLK